MKKIMTYEEFIKFLSNFIEEPKSIKDTFLSNIKYENDNVFYVYIEHDNTVKAEINNRVTLTKHSYIIKMDQESRKYSLSCDVEYRDGNYEIRSYQNSKVKLEYTNDGLNNQYGFIIDEEKRTSNFVRNNGESFGKISDDMVTIKRFFDENGIEMRRNDSIIFYPDRNNQYRFTFGLPEFNFRTPAKYVNSEYYRDGIDTVSRYTTTGDVYNVKKEEKKEHYLLQYDNGRLVFLNPYGDALDDEHLQIHQDYLENCSIEELENVMLKSIGEPMRTGLLEKYGFSNTKKNRR